MLHSPFSIHLCFPLGTVKPCFVSESVTRADPRTVRFSISSKILNFWATIVIQIFYILSEKSGQQSTPFLSLSKYFCIHFVYVVKDSKELVIIKLSTSPRNSMEMTCIPFCLFIRYASLWWRKRTINKFTSSLIMFSKLALYLVQSKTYCFKVQQI